MMIDYTLPLDKLPDPLPIVPLEKPFDVTITPPGSKSITNRAYVLAALAKGESRIIRPLRAEDTDALLNALCSLGAEARWEGDDVFLKGVDGRFPRGGSVNLGDGGTPTRFMIASACLATEPVIVDGSPRMRERPIAEGVEMLRQLGAKIEYVEEEGRLPVRVLPSEAFRGGELRVGKMASSQFISAVMLVAPWLEKGVDIRFDDMPTSRSYISLTLSVLVSWDDEALGQIDDIDDDRVRVGPFHVHSAPYVVQPDASGAAYFLVAAAFADSRVTIQGLPRSSMQPDNRIVCALDPQAWYDDFRAETLHQHVTWPIGRSKLKPIHEDARLFPDGAMALAVAAVHAPGLSRLTGLHTLRVKETDRIAALATELRKIGCVVETTDDSITITPPMLAGRGQDAGATESIVIETYNDHRMAMSFAILGLVRPGLAIRNPKCVAKSYPTFWKDFAKLYGSET